MNSYQALNENRKRLKFYYLAILFYITCISAFSQNQIQTNTSYDSIKVANQGNSFYAILEANTYEFKTLQQGIDIEVYLIDKSGDTLIKKDSPNGAYGTERFQYSIESKGQYELFFKPLPYSINSSNNKTVSFIIREISEEELARKETIRKELASENKKKVQTADIHHFWQAFDALEIAESHADSIRVIQELYIDRATDGLKEFILVRERLFTPERIVATIAKYPKFYNSVRANTFEVEKAVPIIEDVFDKFKELYPNFEPFKVCFAIGTIGTGGTVSNDFVLIGAEISTSTENIDLSEFEGHPMKPVLAYEGGNIVQKLANVIAHECVHTQQAKKYASEAVTCTLLNSVLREGASDFIGGLIAREQINEFLKIYGDEHEKELYTKLKSELCGNNFKDWLYNYNTAKDFPGDLGYYTGYKIVESYYNKHVDKQQAIIDIIEMKDPLNFLIESGYDKNFEN